MRNAKQEIYDIFDELDQYTGYNLSSSVFTFDWHEVDNGLTNLGYCKMPDINKDYIECVKKNLYNINLPKSYEEDYLINLYQQLNKFEFNFTPIALELPYPYLREIVIHEYAHACCRLVNFSKLKLDSSNPHNKQFVKMVDYLGGLSTNANISDDVYYNDDVFKKAVEVAISKERDFIIVKY
nr:MAG TPA: SprT-like domain-containing protein Spartan/DNA Complex repair, protease, DNA BINDING [Caudoviricetes sp.]